MARNKTQANSGDTEHNNCMLTANLQHQQELGISDPNIYDTFLRSWNSKAQTPQDQEQTKFIDVQFVTPTKEFDLSNDRESNFNDIDNLESNSDVADIVMDVTDSLDTIDNSRNELHKIKKRSKQRSISSNSVTTFSLNSVHYDVSTCPRMVKSSSMNAVRRSNSVNNAGDLNENDTDINSTELFKKSSSRSISVTDTKFMNNTTGAQQNEKNESNNMVSKKKSSIYKQFKKFSWQEIEHSNKNTTGNTIPDDRESRSISAEMLFGGDERINNISSGSRGMSFGNFDLNEEIPYLYDKELSETILTGNSLNRRSLNPRSSFSSVEFSYFNNIINDSDNVLTVGELGKAFTAGGSCNNNNTNKNNNNTTNKNNSSVSPSKMHSFDLANYSDDNRLNMPVKTAFHVVPPLLLKSSFIGSPTKLEKDTMNPSFYRPKVEINMLFPYTNDNFDQCAGICKVIQRAKEYQSRNRINWRMTLTYNSATQKAFLLKDIVATLKISNNEALELVENKQFDINNTRSNEIKEDKDLKEQNRSNSKLAFLESLKFEDCPGIIARLIHLGRRSFLEETERTSVSTVVFESGADDKRAYDRENSTLSTATTINQDNRFSIQEPYLAGDLGEETSKELTVPYLSSVYGKAYTPKTLILFLFGYKHFNENASLNWYLETLHNLFTINQDSFMAMRRLALTEIDNESGIYHEYNISSSAQSSQKLKFLFCKPSNDLRIVIDEYFTTYNSEKFQAVCMNDCFASDDNLVSSISSFDRTYALLKQIFKGQVKSLVV